jgi:hypothetical protein
VLTEYLRTRVAYPEPTLLAFTFERLRDCDLHITRDDLEQSMLIATMHRLECIIAARIVTPTNVVRRSQPDLPRRCHRHDHAAGVNGYDLLACAAVTR